MRTEIQYTGMTGNTSDYDSKDGELSQAIDVVAEDGHLECVAEPGAAEISKDGLDTSQYAMVFIHDVGGESGKHIIALRSDATVAWVETADGGETVRDTLLTQPDGFAQLYQFNAIGNTLLALTDKGMYYFLWKDEDVAYKHLGNHLPEVDIKFNLVSRAPYSSIGDHDTHTSTYDTAEKTIKDVYSRGLYIFPFFVRYALRFTTGELTSYSAPILLQPCQYDSFGLYKCTYGKDDVDEKYVCYQCIPYSLEYTIMGSVVSKIRDDWADIIDGIDFFVSPPIYTYKATDTGSGMPKLLDLLTVIVKNTVKNNPGRPKEDPLYDEWCPMENLVATASIKCGSTSHSLSLLGTTAPGNLRVSINSGKDILDEIRLCHTFFLRRSVKFSDDKVDDGYIASSLEEKGEALITDTRPDDFDSHDLLVPTQSKVYNRSLQLTGVSKYHFDGFNPATLYDKFTPQELRGSWSVDIAVSIRDEGYNDVVRKWGSDLGCDHTTFKRFFHYFYYPNTGAYQADMTFQGEYYRLPLTEHEHLNGAYWFGNLDDCKVSPPPQSLPEATHTLVPKLDRMYVSLTDNPFVFQAGDIVSVGGGNSDAEIIGTANVVEALSEGQFGEWPTYLFTGDGVRAAQPDTDTGKGYVNIKPVSRDVCVWGPGITEIDKAVLFPTARGIMLLSGNKTQCISDIIDADVPAGLDDLPNGIILTLVAGLHHKDKRPINPVPFREFVRRAEMAYDYAGQRVIVYNTLYGYAYVYSLKSKTWTMMSSDIMGSVKAYPECLVQTAGGVMDLSNPSGELRAGVVLTRPLKLGAPDVLKTARSVVQRGVFAEGHVWQMLWGSNDMLRWWLITSSKSRYMHCVSSARFKYLRLGLLLRLAKGESVSGCSIEWLPRDDNRLR